ncbi:AAA family ATPase [Thiotrichales bacterium 19S11-10]|nr:AAA family ATPase [Thiotrichales bacterium 19S11-10]
METLKLTQLSELTGIKRHTLNARLSNLFDKNELQRTTGNQIILQPSQARKLISELVPNKLGKIIYIGNLKGGVGKTTLSYLLTSTLISLGFKTCAIDLDVQANFTNQFISHSSDLKVFYDVLDNKAKIEDVIVEVSENLHLLPSSLRNSLIQKALSMQQPKHHLTWFNNLALNYLRKTYDYIIVDTPPSLTTLNSVFCLCLNDLDTIVVPVCPEEFSILGVQMFLDDVKEIRSSYQTKVDPQIAIIMNRFFQNQKANLEILVKMSNLYGEYFSDVVIKDNAKMREIINNKTPIGEIKRGKELYATLKDFLFSMNILKQGNSHDS